MNLDRKIARTWVLGVLAVLIVASLLLVGMPRADAEWTTSVFEEAITIERMPDHIGDRPPFHMEPIQLEIESNNNQMINDARVWVWVYSGGVLQTDGGFQFERINQTAMEVEIRGYPGGYNIQYEVTAFDERNNQITSTRYAYDVIENGSWIDTDFANNIILDWGPKDPAKGENVTINITSRDPLVAIERADLLFTVNIPDQDPIPGVDYFRRINSTVLTYELISYPPGSKITFYVDAYDQYFNKITSQNQVYEYERPPPLEPLIRGKLYIILEDDANRRPANPATVTFSNETFFFETVTNVGGIASTDQEVNQGAYRIEVTYKEETSVFTVVAPDDDKFTFNFKINKQTFQVSRETEDRPYINEAVGLAVVIIILLASFFLAFKVKTIREEMNARKKNARKKTAEAREDHWYEKLVQDEEMKQKLTRCGAILILSLLGLFWAPFYPWWMVILLAAFLTGVAIKFPYISMLIMAVFVTAAAAYQSNEFGWVFLVFSLVVMIGGFFDWKYAYFSFLAVFAAGYGLGFTVPMIAAVGFSLFLGTTVLITAGLFLLVVAPSGTFQWFSFLAVPGHEKSFVQFHKGVDPNWSPVDVANEIGDLTFVDTNILSTVLQDTMGSLIPLFGLIGWGLAMVAVYFIFKKWLKGEVHLDKDPKNWGMRLVPALLIIIFGVISIAWAEVEFSVWMIFPFLAVIPAVLIPFGLRAVGEEALPMEYGVEELKSSDIGKKISEMVGFRKASFKDIGGLEDVKREVKNALMVPLLEPEMATKYGVKPTKGIMLFGPPGCGKTLMLRAVASDLNVEMIGIKCSDVMSKWYGESENLIASLYDEARTRSPCILFLDEIDAIAKRRDFYSTDDVTPRVLSIMLSEMDGMDEAEGIIVVATTNMPDLVDPALMRPGRFDKVIYVPPPDEVSRQEILKVHMKGKFVSDNIDTGVLAKNTKGFSGADIANLIREASASGLERALETKKPQPITMQDVVHVLEEIKPSITPKMNKMYDKLRNEYERKKKVDRGDKEKKEGAPKKKKNPSKDLSELEAKVEEMHDWEDD